MKYEFYGVLLQFCVLKDDEKNLVGDWDNTGELYVAHVNTSLAVCNQEYYTTQDRNGH